MDPVSIYCDLMQELKRRTAVVYGLLHGPYTTPYPATNVECMVLQVRKILELIALGSLVANRDEYSRQYTKFTEHWHAARILRDVEKINPNFYPKPIKEVPSKRPGIKNALVDVTEGFLTKQQLVEVYDLCGEILHAKNPFSGQQDYVGFNKLVPQWMEKIRCLLNTHIIRLIDTEYFLLVHMKEARDDRVHAYTFGKIDDMIAQLWAGVDVEKPQG